MENKREIYEYVANVASKDAVSHHGIKGQKWGRRRYQNLDGSLTKAGAARYGSGESNEKPKGDSVSGGRDKKNDNGKPAQYVKTVDSKDMSKLNAKSGTYETDGDTNRTTEPSIKTKSDFKSVVAPKKGTGVKADETPATKTDDTPKTEEASKSKPASDPGSKTDVKKNKADMTTAELRDAVTRAKLEKQYDEMNAPKDVVGEKLNATKNVLNESANAARILKNVSDDSIRNAPKVKLNLDGMTDAELRNAINRAQLEKQYNDYYAPSTVTKGQQTVNQMLGALTTILSLTGTAVGIAAGIRQILNK